MRELERREAADREDEEMKDEGAAQIPGQSSSSSSGSSQRIEDVVMGEPVRDDDEDEESEDGEDEGQERMIMALTGTCHECHTKFIIISKC